MPQIRSGAGVDAVSNGGPRFRSLHVAHWEGADKKETYSLYALDEEGRAWNYDKELKLWKPLNRFQGINA